MDILVPLTLGVLFLLVLYKYLTRNFNIWKDQGVPGPNPCHYLTFSTIDPLYRQAYGRTVGLFNGSTPELLVSDPEFLRKLFIKEFSSMQNLREVNFGGIANLFLSVLKDDHWKHVRSSLTPIFTTGKLKQMKASIDSCCCRLVNHLERLEGRPFDAKRVFGAFTMDTIASTTFGVDINSLNDPNEPVVKHAKRILNADTDQLPILKKLKMFLLFVCFCIILSFSKPRFGYAGMANGWQIMLPEHLLAIVRKLGFSLLDTDSMDYFVDLTDRILNGRSNENSNRKDFVQLCQYQLIDLGNMDGSEVNVDSRGYKWCDKGLTRDEIVANGIVFFLAGYDTTSNTLQFVMYEFAMNPECQDKKSYKMEYLDWVMEETMRLYPALARISRQVDKDVEVNGIKIPKGRVISAAVYSIHHDPEIWPDPENFDPERYSLANKEGRHPLAGIPFGVGNRSCVGMRLALLEMKLALVNLLKEIKIEKCDTTPTKPIKFKKNLQNQPDTPIELRAVKRT